MDWRGAVLMNALGIDGGGTATRWRLESPSGALIAEGKVAPVSGHIDDPALRTRTLAALAALADAAAAYGSVGAAVAGITGLTEDSHAGAEIAAFLAERFGTVRTAMRVVDDMWIAYHAAFAPGEGIVVYSGTGSVAYHVTRYGAVSRSGGHGYLIDDGGSAAWIALSALRHLVRGLDEAPEAMRVTPLAGAIANAIGSIEWEAIRAFVYGGDRGQLGTLAGAVARAASEGDTAATELLRRAGAELARLAQVLINRHGPKPVALMGGTARLHATIRDAVLAGLPEGVALGEVERRPVEAAAELARQALHTTAPRSERS